MLEFNKMMTYFHSSTLLYTSMFAIVMPKCLAHVPYRSWNSHRCQVHRYVSVLANVGGQCSLPHLPIGRQLEAATRRRATVKGWFSNGSKRCFQDTIDYLVGGLEHLLFFYILGMSSCFLHNISAVQLFYESGGLYSICGRGPAN